MVGKALKIFASSLFIAGLATLPATAHATAQYNGYIPFSPAQITVSPGETFTISVDVQDAGVTYNGVSISITPGDGLSYAGSDYSGSAFNVPGTDQVEKGPYDSCVVISRTASASLTGTSHVANVRFLVTDTPDYDTSHNGTSLEQDWTGCGPSSNILLNGEQANQGPESGGEISVHLTTQTPNPAATKSPGLSPIVYKPAHASANTSPGPGNSKTLASKAISGQQSSPQTGDVESASTVSASASPTASPGHTSAPIAKAFTQLAAITTHGTSFFDAAALGVALLAIVAVGAFAYIRSKKKRPK